LKLIIGRLKVMTLYGDKLSAREAAAVVVMWLLGSTFVLSSGWFASWWVL
jgi:hypothetical protein